MFPGYQSDFRRTDPEFVELFDNFAWRESRQLFGAFPIAIRIEIWRRMYLMWFWWFMFVCDLLTPILMISCGRLMWKHPPGKINGIMGYRTARSMKNPDTWKFAHEYCGRLWWKTGWAMLILSAIVHILFYNRSENKIGIVGGILCTIQCVILIASIFPTERALKRNFTKEGVRKTGQGGF